MKLRRPAYRHEARAGTGIRRSALPWLVLVTTPVIALAAEAAMPWSASGTTAAASLPTPVRHIVVMYDENLSFDHYLGDICQRVVRRTPCNVDASTSRPFDVTAPVTVNTPASGPTVVQPFVGPDLSPQIAHDVASQVKALDNQWLSIRGCQTSRGRACLGYLTAGMAATAARLARLGTVSDQTYSTDPVPSWPGHFELVDGGLLHGFSGENPAGPARYGWGCDSGADTTWHATSADPLITVPACFPSRLADLPNGGAYRPTPVRYDVPTLFRDMDAHGVTWKIYAAPSTDQNWKWAICPSFASCLDTSERSRLVANAQFFVDARNNTLPNVSFFLPGLSGAADWSQHNGNSIAVGENKMADVYNAIFGGPTGATTVLENLKDDCGCFYDHRRPPVISGHRAGPRVPAQFNGPFVKAGYTDSTPADFTSTTAMIEHLMGLPPVAPTAPDATAYGYDNVFTFAAPARAPVFRPIPHQRVDAGELAAISAHAADDADDPS